MQFSRRIFAAAAMTAVSVSLPSGVLRAQTKTPIEGIWSTPFTAPDHPEWNIEDHFCRTCPPVARQHLRRLLADPANDGRSLRELEQETTRVANQYVTGLMTEAARTRQKQDDTANMSAIRCEPPDLITLLMLAPQPMSFAASSDHVVIHHDHWNIERTVSLTEGSAPSADPPTRLGSSIARFEGSTLVVESRNLTAAHAAGIVTTEGARIVERWTASPNGARLNLELIIHDPASYREPLVLTQSRVRTPDEKIFDMPPCEAISGQP